MKKRRYGNGAFRRYRRRPSSVDRRDELLLRDHQAKQPAADSAGNVVSLEEWRGRRGA